MSEKVKYICNACHSDDLVWNGNLYWNAKKQAYDAGDPFDDVYCHQCESECDTLTVPVQWEEGDPIPPQN